MAIHAPEWPRRRGCSRKNRTISAFDPNVRFDKHNAGIQCNVYVQKWGIHLLPQLYAVYNPMPYEGARDVKEPMNDRSLDEMHCGHKLTGDYDGIRECHIESDWLLVYDKDGDVRSGTLTLIRTDCHGELF